MLDKLITYMVWWYRDS